MRLASFRTALPRTKTEVYLQPQLLTALQPQASPAVGAALCSLRRENAPRTSRTGAVTTFRTPSRSRPKQPASADAVQAHNEINTSDAQQNRFIATFHARDKGYPSNRQEGGLYRADVIRQPESQASPVACAAAAAAAARQTEYVGLCP